MDKIEALFGVNIIQIVIGLVIIVVAVKYLLELIDWVFARFGIELKGSREKKANHELLMRTASQLEELEKQRKLDREKAVAENQKLFDKIDILSKMFLDKQIDDIRWEILDFASAIANNQSYGKESWDHILKQYEKYEKILEENNLENGQVTMSMEFIKEQYKIHFLSVK